uniref:Uncharacterized protein n=1 Tax=Arundo donax TaxID=35708 RepID=A0A0A9E6Y3_ARUDO
MNFLSARPYLIIASLNSLPLNFIPKLNLGTLAFLSNWEKLSCFLITCPPDPSSSDSSSSQEFA